MGYSLPDTSVYGIPRQEYWDELSFPSPGDLPNPRIEPISPTLAGRFYTTEPPRKLITSRCLINPRANCPGEVEVLQSPPGGLHRADSAWICPDSALQEWSSLNQRFFQSPRWFIPITGYYSAIKKNERTVYNHMDELWDCHTEWNKSDRGEISYDIPYMWNLQINDTNEIICKTEIDSQTLRMSLWLPGGRMGEGIVGESEMDK